MKTEWRIFEVVETWHKEPVSSISASTFEDNGDLVTVWKDWGDSWQTEEEALQFLLSVKSKGGKSFIIQKVFVL